MRSGSRRRRYDDDSSDGPAWLANPSSADGETRRGSSTAWQGWPPPKRCHRLPGCRRPRCRPWRPGWLWPTRRRPVLTADRRMPALPGLAATTSQGPRPYQLRHSAALNKTQDERAAAAGRAAAGTPTGVVPSTRWASAATGAGPATGLAVRARRVGQPGRAVAAVVVVPAAARAAAHSRPPRDPRSPRPATRGRAPHDARGMGQPARGRHRTCLPAADPSCLTSRRMRGNHADSRTPVLPPGQQPARPRSAAERQEELLRHKTPT